MLSNTEIKAVLDMLRNDFPAIKVFPILGDYPTLFFDWLPKVLFENHLVVAFHTEKCNRLFQSVNSSSVSASGLFFKHNQATMKYLSTIKDDCENNYNIIIAYKKKIIKTPMNHDLKK